MCGPQRSRLAPDAGQSPSGRRREPHRCLRQERGGEGGSCADPASYLSTSRQSCSDTNAFSLRRSPGPFLGTPFLPSPGDLGSTAGGAPPAAQWAIVGQGTRRAKPSGTGTGGVPARTGSPRNPPPEGKFPPRLVCSRALNAADAVPGARGHVTRALRAGPVALFTSARRGPPSLGRRKS